MFRYSWDKLYKFCNEDTKTVLSVLMSYVTVGFTTKTARIISKLSKYEKPSYINDLSGLLLDSTSTDEEKVVYLYIAAKRNIVDALLYEKEWLDYSLVKNLNIEANRLFTIENNKVYFKY